MTLLKFRIYSVSPPPPPPVFFMTPVTNYMLLYSTLLYTKIARAPMGHKRFKLTKLGGGGGQKRSEISSFARGLQTDNQI